MRVTRTSLSRTARLVTATAVLAVPVLGLSAPPAAAAASLSITPITWNVLGVDSNKPSDSPPVGPNVFPVGARVCNTGDVAASGVTSSLVFDSANVYINAQGGTTVTTGALAAGACTDAYFTVQVTRTQAAFDTSRRYHVEATATGLGTVSTPANRELYVEKLISQNRNSVQAITGASTVYVGQTYDYRVDATTTTQGYEQLESFLTFPNVIFQLLSTTTTYTNPTGGSNDTLYADACGWDNVIGPRPSSGTYLSCKGPIPSPYVASAGKAGGTLVTTYRVKVLSAGSGTLASLIYDYSGSSFHYNGDYGQGVNALQFTAKLAPDLALTKTHTGSLQRGATGSYLLTATNVGQGETDQPVTLTDTLPAGLSFVSASGTGWACGTVGQVVTCTLSGAPIAPGGSRPLQLNVAVAANAPASVTNTATVSTSSDPVAANNTATDPTALNSPPVAVNNTATTVQNTAVTLDPRTGDSDPDADALAITSATPTAAHGTVSCTATACTYTPTAGYVGTDSFTYAITDGRGGSATAVVNLTVTDRAPTYTAAGSNTAQSVPVGGSLTPLAASDPDGDALTYAVTGGQLPAGVTLNPNGSFAGSPTTLGTTSVTVTVSDGKGGTAVTTLAVTVTDPATGSIGDLVYDDRNGNGVKDAGEPGLAGGTVTAVAGPTTVSTTSGTNGAYAITGLRAGTYTVTFTPPTGFTATTTTPLTRTVTVAGGVTDADFGARQTDGSLTVTVYTDVDGNASQGGLEGPLAGVAVQVSGNGATYSRTTDANGQVSVTGLAAGSYVVTTTAPSGAKVTTTNPTTIALVAGGTGSTLVGVQPDRAPVAVDDSVSTPVGKSVTLDPRAGDSDPDGDGLTVQSVTQPASGTGTVTCTTTSCSFVPAAGFDGTTTFTYTISDGRGKTATATVTVTVVDTAPAFTANPTNTSQTVAVGSGLSALAATDVDGGTLTYSLKAGETEPPGVSVQPNGTFLGTVSTPGTTSTTYVVTDPFGKTAETTLVVTVNATGTPQAPPVANDDAVSTPKDVAVQIAVRSNDSDPNGDPITVTSASPVASSGTVSCSATTCTFTPATGFEGNATFTYTISDGTDTASATVTVTVTDQAPAFTAAPSNSAQSIPLGSTGQALTALDPNGDAVSYSYTGTLPAGVTFANGVFGGAATTPGTTTISITATASGLSSPAQDLVLTVTGSSNQPPTYTGASTNTSQPLTTGQSATDLAATDTDGGTLTFTRTGGTLPPNLVLNSNGTFDGTVTAVGTYTIDVLVTDGQGGSASTTLTFTVTDANDATVAGTVFEDLDGDGALDAGEPAVSGVTVRLSTGATLVTGTNGTYLFTGLPAGSYTVVTTTGTTGYATTTTQPVPVSVVPGGDATGIDLGLEQTDAVLTGTVFTDSDGDMLLGSTEPGVAGVSVRVTGSGVDTTVLTDSNGVWTVTGLRAGTYLAAVDAGTRTLTTSGTRSAMPQPGATVSGLDFGLAALDVAPVAVDDAISTLQGTARTFSPLGNDSDADGDPLTITSAAPTALHGTVGCDATSCTYTPTTGYVGADSFTYTVSDGRGMSDTAVVTVDVTNAPPVFTGATNNTSQTVGLGTAPARVVATDLDNDGATYTKVGGTLPPGVTLGSDGTFGGAATTAGTYTVTIRATDPFAAFAETTLVITVPVNRPPTYTAAPENTSQVIPVGATPASVAATDPDGQVLTYTVTGTLPPGVGLNGDGTFSGPATGSGSFPVTVTVTDGFGGSASTSLVLLVDSPPVAVDDAVSTPQGTAVPVTVLTNDTDVDGDSLSLLSTGTPAHGTLSCSGATCTYTPTAGYVGTDTFTYVVGDPLGLTDTGLVTVTVTDRAPAFTSAATNTSQALAVGQTPVALAATDVDGDPLTYAVTSGTLPAGVTLTPSGAFTGTATTPGSTTATVTVSDGKGGTATTTLVVTVTAAAQPPVANDDALTTAGGAPITSDPRTNDTDPAGLALTVTAVGPAAHGTVTCTTTSCTYTPTAGYAGADSFTYTLTNTAGLSDTAVVTVTVANTGPAFSSSAANTTQSTGVGEGLNPLSATDANGDALTYAVTAGSLPAGLTLLPGGTFSGTATTPGTTTATVTVSDGKGGTATTTLTVTVAANRPPVFSAASGNTAQTLTVGDTPLALTASDPDAGQALTYAVTSGTLPAGVTLGSDGTFTGGVPAPGTTTVTITVTDPKGATATTTLVLTVVAPADRAPVATDDTATTTAGAPVTTPVLANDTDPDSDPLTVASATQPAHGTVSCDSTVTAQHPAPTCTYLPTAGYTGPDSYDYVVADGRGLTDTGTVQVTVTAAPNNAPAFDPTPNNTAQTVVVGGTPVPVTATDADGDPLVYAVTTGTLPAGLVLQPDGSFTGTATTAGGPTTVVITVTDGRGGNDSTTFAVTITVTPAPGSPPVAVDDSDTTPTGTPVTTAVVANDTDADGDVLQVFGHGDAAHGTVSCTATGCTYTPDAAFTGSDTYTYVVTDGTGKTDTGLVTVTVQDAPPAYDGSSGNTAQTVPVGATPAPLTATDANGDPLVFAVTGGALPAGVTLTPAGAFTGAPTAPGTSTVTVTVTDGRGGSDTTTLVLTVVDAVPAPPVATDDAATVAGGPVTVGVLTNDSGTTSIASYTQPAHGTVVCGATTCTYTPDPGFTGTDTFTYAVSNGQGGVDLGTVVLTVTGTDQAPVANPDLGTTLEDVPLVLRPLANDLDADGDPLSFVSVGTPAHGTVSCTSVGVCTYRPAAGYSGPDSFTYVVSDGRGGSTTGTVTVTVTPVDDRPVATRDTATTTAGRPVTVTVLGNDSDPEGDPLTVTAVGRPGHGTATCTAAGACTYTPDAGFTGRDSFTYTVSDGQGGVTVSRVDVTVTAAGPAGAVAPVPTDDAVAVLPGTPAPLDVLANDTDPQGGPLTVVGSTQPAHGTVTCTPAGVCTYTSAAGYAGADSFTYTVSDGDGNLSTATVRVTVSGTRGGSGTGTGGGLPFTGDSVHQQLVAGLALLVGGLLLLAVGRRRREA